MAAEPATRSIWTKSSPLHQSPPAIRCQPRAVVTSLALNREASLEKQAKVTHKISEQHCGYLPCILLKDLFLK